MRDRQPAAQGRFPREDAVVVARLRAAGALILGTTNCPEFLMAYETANLLHGRTQNPWDLERTPGGSSGGESAAIAAGLSAAGLGSDSGGSVRVPAHFTGICSLKPTPGRIPGRGHLPPCVGPFSILGAIGPMARTMGDVALLFRTLSGQDPLDPVSPPIALREPKPGRAAREHDWILRGRRAGSGDAGDARRGATLRRPRCATRAFAWSRSGRARWSRCASCGGSSLCSAEPCFMRRRFAAKRDQLSPIFNEFLGFAEAVPPLTAAELLDAWAELDLLRAKTLEEMSEYPVLLCPVASIPAFRHGEREWIIEGRTVEYLDAVRHTQWFNALAAPAAVVPVGRSSEGLPIGVQIVARPFQDETALGVAAIVDAAFGYRPPPIALH